MDPADMIAAIDAAISRRGPAFWNELVRERPAVVAQLRATLAKLEDAAPGSTGREPQQVNVLMGEHLAGIAAGIAAPRIPDDLADLDLDTARAELKRLRDENKRLMDAANNVTPPKPIDDRPLMPEPPPGPPVECPQCRRVGYPGRMIEPGKKCKWGCGQWYQDAAEGRETPPPPDPDDLARQAASGIAFSVALDGSERGWVGVADLSTAGIREALGSQAPERGPFE
jgi:hypothetical protein